jgi:membrane associated rhomboid family serine protease
VFLPLRDDNPRTRFPVVTTIFIVANVVVYLFELYARLTVDPNFDQRLALTAGAIPYEILTGVDLRPHDLVPLPFTILTSMFLHGGFWHLVGNMWFLWIFGDNVEEALGPVRYFFFYFVVGIVGALAQVFAMPDSRVPMIGASGAIAGALGAYAVLYPRARVATLVMIPLLWPVIQVRAWIFLGLWFVMQLLVPGSGVAWMAHVGGFLAGAGLGRLVARRRPPPRSSPVEAEYIPPPRRRW